MLTDVEAAIVADEEACLARIHAALAAQPAEVTVTNQSANVAELRELRDEAASAREEEAASLMLELAVQQKLVNRTAPSARPDAKSPYIGHLRLTEGKQTRDYFLGQSTFIETRNNIRIIDWRVAPLAQIFYRYRQGDAFDEVLPEREMSGTVDVRRIVVIHEGKLVQIMGDGLALRRGADGTWERATHDAITFSKGSEGRLGLGVGVEERGTRTDVTALLDAQQYAAISAPADDALVVLGSAGSGKTTVALHRLARLTTSQPEAIPLPRARVVVPEEGLARLCRRILKPLVATLGPEVKPPVETLDEMAIRFARHALGPLPTLTTDTPALVTNIKRHPALHAALKERFTKKPIKRPTLARLLRHLGYALTDRAWLAGVVARAGGTLPTTAIEDTVRHTMLQFADKPVSGAEDVDDDERKTALDGRGLEEGTPDELAQTLDAEDLPVLLSMMAWQGDLKLPQASHLVLDEAEDFSLFDLEVLRVATKTAPTASRSPETKRSKRTPASPVGRQPRRLGREERAHHSPLHLVPLPEADCGAGAQGVGPHGSGHAARRRA